MTLKISMVKHSVLLFYIAYSTASIWLFDSTLFLPAPTPLRLRGGAGDPSSDKSFNEIPYLSNIRFEWDGLPSIDFQKRVLN